MPRLADQGEEREGDSGHDERAAEHDAGAESIRQCAANEARRERRERAGCDYEASDAERQASHVVQVDDQERPDHAVPEHVHEPAGLKDPDLARKLRIQATKVRPHGSRLSGHRGYTGANASVAQGIERAPPERKVAGSIPARRTPPRDPAASPP